MTQNIARESRTIQRTWVASVRIILSILLVWKGLSFIQDTSQLQMIIERTGIGEFSTISAIIAAIISILTLLCGIFLAVGFFTRIVSYTQIVMIAAAVIFIYLTNIERSTFEVISTITVIVLLVFYARNGSGPISFDEHLEKEVI